MMLSTVSNQIALVKCQRLGRKAFPSVILWDKLASNMYRTSLQRGPPTSQDLMTSQVQALLVYQSHLPLRRSRQYQSRDSISSVKCFTVYNNRIDPMPR